MNWNPATVGTSVAIYDVSMLNQTTGWFAGAGGTVRTTSDGGHTWSPQTTGTSQDFSGIAAFNVPVSGDYNGDGVVDVSDYQKWRSTFGSSSDPSADGNDNGIVDAADYVFWRNNYHSSSGTGVTVVAVPESDALPLMLLALLPLASRPWQKAILNSRSR